MGGYFCTSVDEPNGDLEMCGHYMTATEWITQVVALFQGEVCPGGTGTYAKGFVTADTNVNKFPLKMKEPSITEAITFLKKKGLFPDKDDDSDDAYVFGDDDFPS